MRIASTEVFYPPFALRAGKFTGPRVSALRTVAGWSNDEAPDPSFWTPYDHFMVEREARAMRRAYFYSTLGRCWRGVRARMFG